MIGIDGGGLDDLFGLAVLGRDLNTQRWLLWSHAWCHIGVLERRKLIAARLQDFAAAGELTIVDDRLDDLDGIVKLVNEVKERRITGRGRRRSGRHRRVGRRSGDDRRDAGKQASDRHRARLSHDECDQDDRAAIGKRHVLAQRLAADGLVRREPADRTDGDGDPRDQAARWRPEDRLRDGDV